MEENEYLKDSDSHNNEFSALSRTQPLTIDNDLNNKDAEEPKVVQHNEENDNTDPLSDSQEDQL